MTISSDEQRGTPAPTSAWKPAPLPEPPGPAASWPDPALRAREQARALDALVAEDLSRGRALVFLACAVTVTAVATLVPGLVADAAASDGTTGTGPAVAAVLGTVLTLVFGVPALLVLRRQRSRAVRRFALMRQWAALDREQDSDCYVRYGTQGYPQGRFFWAVPVLTGAVIMGFAPVMDPSEATSWGLLTGSVTAGILAWSTMRKYIVRRGWAGREKRYRSRKHRRDLWRERLAAVAASPAGAAQGLDFGFRVGGVRVPPALLYLVAFAPAIVVSVLVATRPGGSGDASAFVLLTGIVLLLLLPVALWKRRRARAGLEDAARRLAPAFGGAAPVHPVRYGLAPMVEDAPGGPAGWDEGPARVGALAVDGAALRLRGADGAALDRPLPEVSGAVLVPSHVLWVSDSVDILLHSGEAIELQSHRARDVLNAFETAGTPVMTA